MAIMKETLLLILKGGLIGVANIIPGVSGGTMAVVLGIYEQLIEALGEFFTNASRRKAYLMFLLKIGIGAVLAVVALSWVMDYLLTYYKAYTYLFFVGLIAGSIPTIYRSHHDMKFDGIAGMAFAFGAVLILLFEFSGVQKPEVVVESVSTVQLPLHQMGALFVGGILAGGSMIVPGISGSFMLVLLGQYETVIRAVKTMNVGIIGILGAGVVLGILIFARLMDVFLKKWPRETFYFILGLVVASLIAIFPGVPQSLLQFVVGTGILLSGIVVATRLERI